MTEAYNAFIRTLSFADAATRASSIVAAAEGHDAVLHRQLKCVCGGGRDDLESVGKALLRAVIRRSTRAQISHRASL